MRFAAVVVVAALALGCGRKPVPPPKAQPPPAVQPPPAEKPEPPPPVEVPKPAPAPSPEPPPDSRFARLEWEANRIPLYPGVKTDPPNSNEMNGVVFITHDLLDAPDKIAAHYAQAFKDLGWIRRADSESSWDHRDGGMELYLQFNQGNVIISLNLK